MSVQLRKHTVALPGQLRFAVVRTGRPGEPETKLLTGQTVGEKIHWDPVMRPPLFPGELEDFAKVLQEIAIEARKHQSKQTKRRNHGGEPPSDTDPFGA